MSLNLSMQLFFSAVLLGNCLLFLKNTDEDALRYDRWLFLAASVCLVAFASFRPFGVGTDDLFGYSGPFPDMACPTFECGRWIQGQRDQGWYSIIGLLKSLYPHPQVVLWLSGIGLSIKLLVIYRLCQYRSLALLFYISCFYIIDDVIALRISLAVTVYLLGFYLLVTGRFLWGGGVLAVNGVFHLQAFSAPVVLAGHWLPLTMRRVYIALFLPLILLMLDIYPGDSVLHWLMSFEWGNRLTAELFHGYQNFKLAGRYDNTRIWPVVVPPTLLLSAWLIGDLRGRHHKLFQYTATSLIVAVLFLWGYAVVPEAQMRLWHFFLVPIIFVVGNARLTLWKLLAICALSLVYLLKYTVLHDRLQDQYHVLVKTSPGGYIQLIRKGIPCGEGCGISYSEGAEVILVAKPNTDFRFVHWISGCEGIRPSCRFEIDKDVVAEAVFMATRSLSIETHGSGRVAVRVAGKYRPCKLPCTLTLDANSPVELSPLPDKGFRFTNWSGNCRGVDPVCPLAMTEPQSVGAHFIKVHEVVLSRPEGGQIEWLDSGNATCPTVCKRPVDLGSGVKLRASPAAGYRFVAWSGGCQGQEPVCELKPTNDVTLTALFNPLPTYPLQLKIIGQGRVTSEPAAVSCKQDEGLVSCRGVFSVVTLRAVPAAGFVFRRWVGCGAAGSNPLCRMTLNGASSIIAEFIPAPLR